ncbi:4-hydroxy-3-methylbut-2-enyl diphosphate reductase [Helicobacter canadensis]|uniref:4-hydroxy-3-methylbut-2-enyl diphosphate reductase n=1 Tax=Helicobacter canadensis MIT 98-5491 TaxID=537970 RepID=C5ZZ78_9HELI|nr:4-hydroxy-3-methylbut-2-enyl diphosphate reductase [Helicobacter canadensis]EES89336.1 putative penicillin tolerance protein [Helicobacter canadensis MIT 98-5491]EFR48121.1 4-hydroxy-3-methylbut-2-enyl diphosphate reductase [Helicobacter canadensis MIT 98-5491]STO99371.1 4-hydroxy-3-methylbut-2-enyl diphosphate reductase [Helicobacter canadensis]
MQVKLAKSYGFCFGVRRAIKLAENKPNGITLGPLIHNAKEINRLKDKFNVVVNENIQEIPKDAEVIIRTHGITKEDLQKLKEKTKNITDATCPFVTKPQEICEKMSNEGYGIIIFGDEKHPEVKGVMSYCKTIPLVVESLEALKKAKIPDKVALISQTTKNIELFLEIADFLIRHCSECRVFNTICNATFDNQESARNLAKEVDIMVIVGGKNSSNTKQLYNISKEYCEDCYLIEDFQELHREWFKGKKLCGVSAGASTPNWIINEVVETIQKY